MGSGRTGSSRADEADVVAAARAGDESAFAGLVERYRRELQVHCYRMVGSFEDSEDLVQETFLRAWRKKESFEGRSTFRKWLYRIATNACLDALVQAPRRVLPHHLGPPADPSDGLRPAVDLPWLQPYPDRLLESVAPTETEPGVAIVARETIELAFLAAIQHLPPRQRAVLILRDVLAWPAKDIAVLLDGSVASVNSALQRARTTMKEHLPERRMDWAPTGEPTDEERALLQRYMAAFERADVDGIAALLRKDAFAVMPPWPTWFAGRDAIVRSLVQSFDPRTAGYRGPMRIVPIRANRQPAVAAYARAPGDPDYRIFALSVLRLEGGMVAEMYAFHFPALFEAFGLPATLDRDPGSM